MRVPKYRLHKASGRAVVEHNGQRQYLVGLYGSPESLAAYEAFRARVVADQLALAPPPPPPRTATVADAALAYWQRIDARASGDSRGEREATRDALKVLNDLFGGVPAESFGPRSLRIVRERFLARGWSRQYANAQVRRIVRAFRIGASLELCTAAVSANLATLPGLRRGESGARESKPIGPVAWEAVERLLPHVSGVVAAMVRVQWHTAMRPAEVCGLRLEDIDRSGEVWTYRPAQHKTAHHGHGRTIWLGPLAQAAMADYLDQPGYVFTPARAWQETCARWRNDRQSVPKASARPRRLRDRYSAASYLTAVRHGFFAMAKALNPKETRPAKGVDFAAWLADRGITYWHPNQLRHTRATAIRQQFGLEAAQVALGHSRADTTQLYAERDNSLGARVALMG